MEHKKIHSLSAFIRPKNNSVEIMNNHTHAYTLIN